MTGENDYIEIETKDASEIDGILQKLKFEIYRESNHHGNRTSSSCRSWIVCCSRSTGLRTKKPRYHHTAFTSDDVE